MLIITSIMKVLTFVIISVVIVLILNYLIDKDFRQLISKIKRVISTHKSKKITQIQNILTNYFFD